MVFIVFFECVLLVVISVLVSLSVFLGGTLTPPLFWWWRGAGFSGVVFPASFLGSAFGSGF